MCFVVCLKEIDALTLPQAQVSDLITSREAEKPQWAFRFWLISPVFRLETLQAPHWGAFSLKFCCAISGHAWLRPSKSPEGHVVCAAGGVTAEHFCRQGILLMQIWGIWASPVPPPPAPPATARISHKLCLNEAFRVSKRHPTTSTPLCCVLNISKVQRIQDPYLRGCAGGTPAASPLLENYGLLSSHWM